MIFEAKTYGIIAVAAAFAASIVCAQRTDGETSVKYKPTQVKMSAPEITGITTWINSVPLSLQKLHGKVILIDFWTYTCGNCINTLPHVIEWDKKYKERGLVVVGIHTPEYPFESDTGNLRTAIKQLKITYPVAQDNDYKTWTAFHNQYWPAVYLVDKKGRVVYTHFGEGDYSETAAAIEALLSEN
jgi:thiol-disulfide isomerase/thioredoxin